MDEWVGEMVGPDEWETCRDLIQAGSVFAFLAEHHRALLDEEADTRRRYASLTPSESTPEQQKSWDRVRLRCGF
ncbi:hypothetical protein [Streptomyces sp. WAC 05379]|uniref:hypothetical protein n=1 Tax=Streptomyces sp. WAC 05379 TaxID=2203207 RepID=UPI000F74AAB4|nr:hypothetical protein [Streptomyces sp. WAC 05379]